MTEEEVLQKMETFKNAIIALKDKVKKLEEENAALKNGSAEYTAKVEDKLSEIEKLLNED